MSGKAGTPLVYCHVQGTAWVVASHSVPAMTVGCRP
jgi:hypothetical protein